jgi:hypothetical protein
MARQNVGSSFRNAQRILYQYLTAQMLLSISLLGKSFRAVFDLQHDLPNGKLYRNL